MGADIARGAQCWVPDPTDIEMKPVCATAECAAGILPNRKPILSMGYGGCLGGACIESDTRDSAPSVRVPFPPNLGGGLSFCISEVPKDSCGADRQLAFGLGESLGISIGEDGTACINIGFALASPIEFSAGTGKPLW